MKKKMIAVLTVLALLFCVNPVYAAQQESIDFVGDPGSAAYSVTISFNGNGGSGSMADLTVTSGTSVILAKNAFTREGFTFTGWNTEAGGTGTAYADQASAVSFATAANNGKTIVLYAQWKMNAPSIKTVKTTNPGALKVTFNKVSQASSYEIQYSLNKNFKKAKTKTVTVKKSASSDTATDLVPGKKYYVRMRSYDSSTKSYSDWSAVKNKKTKNGCTLANTKASTGIEADVTLKGSGTGYHAKLVLVTPTSAVSYGIQFDQYAVAPYTGKAMAMIENVASNAAGGQRYERPGNKSLKVGQTYHLMITIDKNGRGNVYLDYKKIGSFSNSQLANQAVYPRVEAAVRLNGDSVTATFGNIKLTRGGKLQEGIYPNGTIFPSNKGIKTKRVKNQNKVTISGKGVGIHGDWDSDYENVSGIYQF